MRPRNAMHIVVLRTISRKNSKKIPYQVTASNKIILRGAFRVFRDRL